MSDTSIELTTGEQSQEDIGIVNIPDEQEFDEEGNEKSEEKNQEGEESKIKRTYFSPDELTGADAVAAFTAAQALGFEVAYNYDTTKEVPEGYGIGILPINIRTHNDAGQSDGNRLVGVCIAAVPDPSHINSDPKGAEWIRSCITDRLLATVANAVRPRKGKMEIERANLPFAISHFLAGREREDLAAFQLIGPTFVKIFKEKMGVLQMSMPVLRKCLQSSVFAHSVLPGFSQENWETMLGAMIALCGTEKFAKADPALFTSWADTRDDTTGQEMHLDAFEAALADLA